MSLTKTNPTRRHSTHLPKRFPAHAPSHLVPEARVKEMLHEIAYVLHVTRRLSTEIRRPGIAEAAVAR
jgi:hypothetical protein